MIPWWLHYFQVFVPGLTFERKRRIGWAAVGCVGRIRSSLVSTWRRNMVYSSINILRRIFSSSFSSFLACFLSSSLLLPPHPLPLDMTYVFSKAETIIPLQSGGESWISLFWREHERLKLLQYAEIGLEQWLWQCLIVSVLCKHTLLWPWSCVFWPRCSNKQMPDRMLHFEFRYCAG